MTRRQQQKAETARRIFLTAVQLFREQGFERTTVEEITRAAGVAKGTFFAHFASKEQLLDHIGELQMERITAAIAADQSFSARPPRERLHAIVAILAAGITSQPAEMRALNFEILARRSLIEVDPRGLGALDALLEQIVVDGQRAGDLRSDTPSAQLALLVRGSYFLALFSWLRDERVALGPLAASYLDLVLDGIARDP